jgi:alanyl-tRNA synthetase
MNTSELRKSFLNYFQKLDHSLVSSSSLIPANDPTLLFTNAGMVQFKEVFLGKESRPYVRAVSAQRCVRAGGKHNDLENVGYTARHHTFFEMLGNFSFGDYFKREAIEYAWRYLTDVLKIPKEKLWVSVFHEDKEAEDIWLKEMKIDPQRFSRCGEKDNFWSMGETGPCGPCTEIFYDHGPEIPGGPPGSANQEGDRYIEIWNLVFMQYNRSADGKITPLPKPSVDTGMGLERMAAVLQGVHNNYEIDIFRHLIQAAAQIAHTDDLSNTSLQVIADHIRSTAFLISDGIRPSNEERGYVLRRIIRRAIRHGHKLGIHDTFFYKLVKPLVEEMGEAYPELRKAQSTIEMVLKHEEEQFENTLDQGLRILEQQIQRLSTKVIPGEVVFRLYDTYGFPPDLTGDIARERGLSLDYAGFEAEMAKQREQSMAASHFSVDYGDQLQIQGETQFTGYERMSDEGKVIALVQEGQLRDNLQEGAKGAVILDRTPFYAESGGQVGDKGKLYFDGGVFEVEDTQKQGLVYLHQGIVTEGNLKLGNKISAEVDASRFDVMLNHSATHLLHATLRHLLGEHVIQKGSLVDADRLRFDFSYFQPLTAAQLKAVEQLVNQQIRANLHSHIEYMTPDQAREKGALALFGEKYGDEVRVLSVGEFSKELCGGTHVENTGSIGLFKIISETGVAAGIRRIEAVTGAKALEYINQQEQQLQRIAEMLKTAPNDLTQKLEQLLQKLKSQEKALEKLKWQSAQSQLDELINNAIDVQGIKLIISHLPDMDIDVLRNLLDQLKQKLDRAVIVFATSQAGRVQLIVGVTKNCTDKIHAGQLVAYLAERLGGKGGGRPDMAQGGGDKLNALEATLSSVQDWIRNKIEV